MSKRIEGLVRYRPAVSDGGNPFMEFCPNGNYLAASEAEDVIHNLSNAIQILASRIVELERK